MNFSDKLPPNPVLLSFLGITSIASGYYLWNEFTKKPNEEGSSTPKLGLPKTLGKTQELCSIGCPLPAFQDPMYEHCIYLDYNATTPIYPEVFNAMYPYLTTCFGNPSSSHVYGKTAKEGLIKARQMIGNAINASLPMKEIYFTSCGSESDNRAIDIALHHQWKNKYLLPGKLPHIITSSIEHIAILCYLRQLEVKQLIQLTILPVNHEGFIDLTALEAALTPETALVTIMHSNNEVGSIQPIRAISQMITKYNQLTQSHILFHTDSAQSFGKVPMDLTILQVDMMTMVGHKIGAPKGIGALYVKSGIEMKPMLIGGGQEHGQRAGTENIPYIIGLATAIQLSTKEIHELLMHYLTLKLLCMQELMTLLKDYSIKIRFNGPERSCSIQSLQDDLRMIKILLKTSTNSNKQTPVFHSTNTITASTAEKQHSLLRVSHLIEQLPNTISVSFDGINGHQLVERLGSLVACSAGSACHEAPKEPLKEASTSYSVSEVLVAMKIPTSFALGTLRLSLGRHTTSNEIKQAMKIISETVISMWNEQS